MKIRSTLLYGASGSFEEVTVKKWKKLRVMAHKASGNLTNITQRYLDQQAAMKMTVALFKATAQAVYKGWQESKSFPGEYAAFVGYTLRNAVTFASPGSPAFTTTGFKFAKGSMPATIINSTSASEAGEAISVFFPTAVGYKQGSIDIAGMVVFNLTTGKFFGSTTENRRNDGGADLFVGPGFISNGDDYVVWLFFYGDPETETAGTSSDSVYTTGTAGA